MRSLLILTTLFTLLIVGYLVIQNMDSHRHGSENGQVEEIEQARKAATQSNEKLRSVREAVTQGAAPALP